MINKPIQESFPPSLHAFVSSQPEIHLMSSNTFSLLRELNREDISNRELANLVQKNPVLVSRVLQVSNSAYFGVARKISTVTQAVTMLGIYQVKAIVQSVLLEGFWTERGGLARVIGAKLFSAHSLAMAYLCGRLARLFRFQIVGVGEAETAGLLHDIGLCLIGSGDRAKYEGSQRTYWNRIEKALKDGDPFSSIEIESETLGFTHADVGGWLASEWNLPPVIQYAIRGHHGSIDGCLNKEMATILHLAEYLSNLHGLDYLPMGACEVIDESVLDFIQQQGRMQVFEELESQLADDIKCARSLFDLALQDGDKEPAADTTGGVEVFRSLREPAKSHVNTDSPSDGTSYKTAIAIAGFILLVGTIWAISAMLS